VAVPLMSSCRRRVLILMSLASMSVLLLLVAWLERDEAARESMGWRLALTLALWWCAAPHACKCAAECDVREGSLT
jgi:hypothetical protein